MLTGSGENNRCHIFELWKLSAGAKGELLVIGTQKKHEIVNLYWGYIGVM